MQSTEWRGNRLARISTSNNQGLPPIWHQVPAPSLIPTLVKELSAVGERLAAEAAVKGAEPPRFVIIQVPKASETHAGKATFSSACLWIAPRYAEECGLFVTASQHWKESHINRMRGAAHLKPWEFPHIGLNFTIIKVNEVGLYARLLLFTHAY